MTKKSLVEEGARRALTNLPTLPPFVALGIISAAAPDPIAFAKDVTAYYEKQLSFEKADEIREDGRYRLKNNQIWMGPESKPIRQRGGYLEASQPSPFLCNTWYYLIFWDEWITSVKSDIPPEPHHYLIFFDCDDFPRRQISPVQNVPVFTAGKMWSILLPAFDELFGDIVSNQTERDAFVEGLVQEDFEWGNGRIAFYPLLQPFIDTFPDGLTGLINYPFGSKP